MEKKKTVILKFLRRELLYDIRNLCYIEGDTKDASDEHQKHQIFDVGEDGNVDRVTRVLDLTFQECMDLCYPYSKKEAGEETMLDDSLSDQAVYIMNLLVPKDFSDTTINLLKNYIHELLVYRVMADWTSHTKPESEAKWAKKAEDVEEKITSSLNYRVGRVRRTLSPFG